MAKGAKLMEVVYLDTQERAEVLVGIGDAVRGVDWAAKEYPLPERPAFGSDLTQAEVKFNVAEYRKAKAAVEQMREDRSALYAVFLGAERGKLRGADAGWLDWLSMVTMPDDASPDDLAEAPETGESAGPPSGI